MAFHFFAERRRPKKSPASKKCALSHQLEEVRRQKLEIETNREQILRKLEDFPRQLEERERKRRELMRQRAKETATSRVLGETRVKIHSVTADSFRRSKAEYRLAMKKLLILCAILLLLVLVLFRTIH